MSYVVKQTSFLSTEYAAMHVLVLGCHCGYPLNNRKGDSNARRKGEQADPITNGQFIPRRDEWLHPAAQIWWFHVAIVLPQWSSAGISDRLRMGWFPRRPSLCFECWIDHHCTVQKAAAQPCICRVPLIDRPETGNYFTANKFKMKIY